MTKPPKKIATPIAKPYPRKAVECRNGTTAEEQRRHYAELVTSPELAAYRVINKVEEKSGIGQGIDVPTLMAHLRDQGKAVNRGDLSQAEAMLMNQATTLQSLFARLAERAMGNDTISAFEANMRMALRAQNQCRSTLETLAAIKNPPVVYARQANVTTGPQQVNNGGTASCAREMENMPNQLLGADHGEWTDSRTAGAAINSDPAMATLD
jgi:hypothetical protein